MKKFLVILVLAIGPILIHSCAKPTVVNVTMPEDEKLNCEQLENAVAEAQKLKRDAEYAKDATGGNVTRMLLFWPAWAQTLHNADVAIMAADDRSYHLVKIMKEKKCKNINIVSAEMEKTTSASENIADQLKTLKELYDSGGLTKEEYKKAKEKILK